MSEVPESELVGRLRAANGWLRELLAAKDAEFVAVLAAKDRETAELREALRELTLRVADLERQRGSGSDDSGTPTSKESIAARERRKTERKSRDTKTSSRERSADRSRGGQPGHPGHGLVRDPAPQHREQVDPPAECRSGGAGLAGADDAGTAWSQCWDVRVVRWRTEYLLPRRRCTCTAVTTARPPTGGPVNGIGFGPVLNTAAVALTAFGNVPTGRAAHLIGMLTGQDVSAGFVDRAGARLAEQLAGAGFDEALLAALLAEPVLTADESPVEVVTPTLDSGTGQPVGAPHVLVLRTPDERLIRLTASDSRRHADVVASLRTFTGSLIVDGFTGYQKLIPPAADPDDDCPDRAEATEDPAADEAGQDNPAGAITGMLAGIQQCCQHITRRCQQVVKLGPGGLQSWASKIITVLGEAHDKVQLAKADGRGGLDPVVLAALRARYDTALTVGITHNRHRDWHEGNHPGYTLATWLAKHADQVWLFTTNFAVDWTSNAAERGIKPAKRHQAVSGYWQTAKTLARWCLINSYLTSARNHGLTALDAITRALTGNPWLPQHALA
ncbi:MAG: transposase [Actinomycetota bacterium]|nr:transposase [Actinomycetota bacterium]